MSTSIETRRDARELNRPKAPAQRQAIIDLIRSRGLHGCTSDEAEVALGLPHQTCSARFCELKAPPDGSEPLIETIGEVRKTRTGARAIVYIIARNKS